MTGPATSLDVLISLMIELEDSRLVTFHEYPRDVARWLHQRGVRVTGDGAPYVLQDPCQYRPGWEIYTHIARGHVRPA